MTENKKPDNNLTKDSSMKVTPQEQKLLELIRDLDYGEMRILIKNGEPVHIEEIKKSIKL